MRFQPAVGFSHGSLGLQPWGFGHGPWVFSHGFREDDRPCVFNHEMNRSREKRESVGLR